MNPRAFPNETEMTVTQSTPPQEVHLLDLLIILLERRRFILLFTLGVAILTAITVLILPSRYTAETVVLPPGQESSMGSALLAQLGGSSGLASLAGGSLGLKSTGELYVSLFKSRSVEDAMIDRFGLMGRYRVKFKSDARRALENHISIALGNKDGLIRITVNDKDPKVAADLANGYVDEFRKLSEHLAISEAAQRRAFFQQQLLEANENLAGAEEAMKRTQQATGVLQLDSQARSLIESAGVIRGQIAAKEVELEAMRTYAAADNPQMIVVQEQLTALKDQLAKLSGTQANSASDIIVPKGNIPEAGLQYIRSLRDVKYYETIEQLIAKQFEMAKLDEAREGALVQVADAAVPPDKRSFPKRTISVIFAAILAFFAASGWCLFQGALLRLKNNPAERERIAALRTAYRKRFW